MTPDPVLQTILRNGAAAADLDRWLEARGITADEALLLILDVPVESERVRNAVLTWYLRRSGAAAPTSPLSMEVAAAVLAAAVPNDDTLRRIVELLTREYADACATPPAWLGMLVRAQASAQRPRRGWARHRSGRVPATRARTSVRHERECGRQSRPGEQP